MIPMGTMRRQATDRLSEQAGGLELPIDLEHPDRMPQQHAFINDWLHRFVGYGGGYGNGKTTAGVIKAILLSTQFPGNQGLICRWEGNDLRTSTMQEFYKICPPQLYKKNEQLGIITFHKKYGGSTILFQGLKDKYIGPNLGWFWIDQAEEVPVDRFTDLIGRIRREVPLYDREEILRGYAKTYGFVTFNPPGSAHWLYKFFHPESPERLENAGLYMGSTYDAVRAGFVTQEYVNDILKTHPPEAAKRYLDGCWDSFEDRVYPELDSNVHRLPQIPLPKGWPLCESIDWGPQSPTSVGWYVASPPCSICEQPTVIRCGEHYEGGGKGVAYHAAIMKNRRGQFDRPVQLTYLDSACWAKNQSNGQYTTSIHDEFVVQGIVCVPGAKDWEVSYSRITRALKPCPGSRHPVTGDSPAPHFYYMEHCTAFEREGLSYVWKKLRGALPGAVSDTPVDRNDHAMDELAYYYASYFPRATLLQAPRVQNPLQLLAERRKSYNPLLDAPKKAGSWMSV